jgi:hypothetical protein
MNIYCERVLFNVQEHHRYAMRCMSTHVCKSALRLRLLSLIDLDYTGTLRA